MRLQRRTASLTGGLSLRSEKATVFVSNHAQKRKLYRALSFFFVFFCSVCCVFSNGKLVLDATVSELLYPRAPYADEQPLESSVLTPTQVAQPATVACSLGAYDILAGAGFSPDFVAGHSLGELSALHAAGYMDRSTLAEVVVRRGQAMSTEATAGKPTAMVAVLGKGAGLLQVPRNSGDVWVANKNGPEQVVLAGAKADVERFVQQHAKQFRTVPLRVSNAFHTKFMAPAARAFAETLNAYRSTFENTIRDDAQLAVKPVAFSNVTAKPYPRPSVSNAAAAAEAVVDTLSRHITSPVEFIQQVQNMHSAGARVFVEFGPRRALAKFAESILCGEEDVVSVAVNASGPKGLDSEGQLRDAVVQLAVLGVPLTKPFDPWAAPNVHHLGSFSHIEPASSTCTCHVDQVKCV